MDSNISSFFGSSSIILLLLEILIPEYWISAILFNTTEYRKCSIPIPKFLIYFWYYYWKYRFYEFFRTSFLNFFAFSLKKNLRYFRYWYRKLIGNPEFRYWNFRDSVILKISVLKFSVFGNIENFNIEIFGISGSRTSVFPGTFGISGSRSPP